MAYLIGSLGSFSQAIISLWFRIPSGVYSAVYSLTEFSDAPTYGDGFSENNGFFPAFYKCVPLISFGAIETAFSYADNVACQPSFIGIDFSGIQANSPGSFFNGKTSGTLCCNLQTPNILSTSKTPIDPSAVVRPECYYMSGVDGSGNGAQLIATPDKWHHALISFDLTAGLGILYIAPTLGDPFPTPSRVVTPGPQFTWAFDDRDRTTDDTMSPSKANDYVVTGQSAIDQSYIMSNGPLSIVAGGDQFDPPGAPTDFQVTVGAGSIGAGPVGIPANVPGSVYNIEMAELQFYTGKFIDTRDVNNRRLFVTSAGKPAGVAVSTQFLGKTPEIYLGGSSKKWIAGTNQGTAGNFTPTGVIKPYTPGPSLG